MKYPYFRCTYILYIISMCIDKFVNLKLVESFDKRLILLQCGSISNVCNILIIAFIRKLHKLWKPKYQKDYCRSKSLYNRKNLTKKLKTFYLLTNIKKQIKIFILSFACDGTTISYRSVKRMLTSIFPNHSKIIIIHEISGECV